MTARRRSSDTQAIEARLAARLSSGLAERAEQLPHDIGERLRVARDQAVARAAEVRRKAPQAQAAADVSVVGVTAHGAALLGPSTSWWQRVASVLPLVVLVGGLLLLQRQAELEQVHAAAEVDAQLLADDLPPDAYTDPGFAEFLRKPAP
jgi:hypothetical protein